MLHYFQFGGGATLSHVQHIHPSPSI